MERWNRYPLQEEAPEGGGGGDPPKDPPKDPPADPPEDPPKVLDALARENLPEDLRDRPDAEIKFLLEHMVSTLGTRNDEVDGLRTELAELRGEVKANQPPAEPDPDDDKTLEELMLEDSGKAIDRYMKEKGYVSVVGELSGRVDEAEFSMIAGRVEGFDEHKDAVRKMLTEGKLPFTEMNIMGAYKMILGENLLAEKARGDRTNSGSIPPSNSPPPDPDKDKVVISSLEHEVAVAHKMSDEEWVKNRDLHLDEELKLPT